MRRPLIALAVPVLVIVGAAGCSKESTTSTNQAQGTTTQAPTSASTKATTGDTKQSGTTKPSDTKSSTTTSKSSSTTTSPGGISIPSIPNAGQIQKCVDMATAYATVHANLGLGTVSKEQLDQAKAELERIKESVPENIKDDLEVIESGIEANSGNLTGLADFFNSDEYKNADKEISDYLEKECNKLDG